MSELAITTADAESLEAAFLGGMDEAQHAFERILASEAWTALGFDSLGHWWDERVKPTMRALSMSPSKELAIAVVEKVREEEASLPPAQRRTQRDLADMVGVSQGSPAIRPRSAPERDLSPADLEQHRTPAASMPEPTPVAPAATQMPARQADADPILATIDDVISAPAPTRAQSDSRDRDMQISREVASKNLARSVWMLAQFAGTADAVDRMAKNWQPSQDIYPKPTTADRMRAAAAYLNSLAERWAQ